MGGSRSLQAGTCSESIALNRVKGTIQMTQSLALHNSALTPGQRLPSRLHWQIGRVLLHYH